MNNEKLRAIAGIMIVVLAISMMILKQESQTLNYIMIGLACFLVGGNIGDFNKKE